MEQLTFDLSAVDSTPARRPRSRGLRIDTDGRQCGECGDYKPWDDFHISRTTRYGHVTICKPCMSGKGKTATAARRAAMPTKVRPTCSISTCKRKVHCRTWCKRHYEQWRTRGKSATPTAVRSASPVERPDLPGENWRPVPTFEGLYEVSDQGRVWSVPRVAPTGRIVGGNFLKGDRNTRGGYVRMGLKRPGKNKPERHFVHRLVLWAFTGENPPDLDTRHLDGNPVNNRWAPGASEEEIRAAGGNLMFGTAGENAHDRVRHGTWVNNNRFAGVTKCIHGHDFDEANTYWRPTGGRACKACARDRYVAKRAAAKEAA